MRGRAIRCSCSFSAWHEPADRASRGLHQWQLGELLNRSDDWVYRVESGRIPVNNVKMLADLAEALRVHVEALQGVPALLGRPRQPLPRGGRRQS
ncbi:helix-turn-helix domain-containing protein [Streptomyces boncukensis]|uniref:helix-turn-helix domain-containing protein n=1 Tax=Streptomyces boncukensis TaxID=2711219 RepID=UPI001F493F94|nr:helix-turn-helix transcriptional regulator [Streptomyces boncukensis]